MIRHIYLIRHGRPQPLDGQRRCLSLTDLPLSREGEAQAEALAEYLSDREITAVYTSPLSRARDTARAIDPDPIVSDDLREVSAGQWEGLPFSEIEARWPERYALRGQHLGTVAPPGGESLLEAGMRLHRALQGLLANSQGNIALVTHGGALRGWLCGRLGLDPDHVLDIRQPWGGITEAVSEGGLRVLSYGLRPGWPTEADYGRLCQKYHTPRPVIDHCRAVARRALELARGHQVNEPLLYWAALCHDLMRTQGRDHPAAAARVLDGEGWPALAEVVARHHDLGTDPGPEAEILALADRLTRGSEVVTLEARFEEARAKCQTPEALSAWRARYEEALRLYEKYC